MITRLEPMKATWVVFLRGKWWSNCMCFQHTSGIGQKSNSSLLPLFRMVFLVVNEKMPSTLVFWSCQGYQIGPWHRSPHSASRQAAGEERKMMNPLNPLKIYRIRPCACLCGSFWGSSFQYGTKSRCIHLFHVVEPEQQGGNHRKSESTSWVVIRTQLLFSRFDLEALFRNAKYWNWKSDRLRVQEFRKLFTVAPWNMQTSCGVPIRGRHEQLRHWSLVNFNPARFLERFGQNIGI